MKTYSFLRLTGSVGTNFIFCVPARVVSVGFFARLATPLGGPDEPDAFMFPSDMFASLGVNTDLPILDSCETTKR